MRLTALNAERREGFQYIACIAGVRPVAAISGQLLYLLLDTCATLRCNVNETKSQSSTDVMQEGRL